MYLLLIPGDVPSANTYEYPDAFRPRGWLFQGPGFRRCGLQWYVGMGLRAAQFAFVVACARKENKT